MEAHFWLKALEAVYETKQKKMKSPVQGNLKHLIFLWKKIMYFAVLVKNMLVTLLHIYYLFLFSLSLETHISNMAHIIHPMK